MERNYVHGIILTLRRVDAKVAFHSLEHLDLVMHNSRWILEFDYSADPDLGPEEVRADLFETLSRARGPFSYDSDCITFENSQDALTVRLRFNRNIVAIDRA